MDDKLIEIVAPAGDMESMRAAVEAGADALYLGIKGYGARKNAVNFSLEELEEAVDYAHLRGVKIYLTLNTLMKDTEIEALSHNLKRIYEMGVDAFIIQDIGFFKFLKENFPDMEFHASTQMGITNSVEAAFIKKEGFKRAVLARELSFEEIESINNKSGIELEIFVSGALCVCYSGRCYMSSFIGGRSGNRGLCAQPCRKTYDKEGKKGYFLSPKDQMFEKEEIEKLIKAGIHSIKIEGRMKNPVYVYETVKYYRDIIDGRNPEKRADSIFNRGYSKGYFHGNEKNLINENYSFNFGKKIGEIQKKGIKFLDGIISGDGIAFVDEEFNILKGEYFSGTIINGEKKNKIEKGETVEIRGVPSEAKYIYRTYDKKLNDEIIEKIKKDTKKIKIYGEINIFTGKPLNFVVKYKEININLKIDEVLSSSKNMKITEVDIENKLSEIGNTSFVFEKIKVNYDGEAFIPFKYLKEIKREAIEKLEMEIKKSFKRKKESEMLFLHESESKNNLKIKDIELIFQIKNKNQEEFLKKKGYKNVYYDSIPIVRESNINIESTGIIKNIRELLQNKNKKIKLDWSMNIINSYSIEYYGKFANIETIYISPELSFEEISKLKKGNKKIGMLIYGMIRVMYIEYPIFGNKGEEKYEIENDEGDILLIYVNKHKNTEVYLKKPLNIIEILEKAEECGIDELRIDFNFENEIEMEEIIKMYDIKLKAEKEPFKNIELKKQNYYNYEKGVW